MNKLQKVTKTNNLNEIKQEGKRKSMPPIRLAHIGLGHMHSHQKLDCIMARPDLFDVRCIVAPEDEDRETPCYAEGLVMYPQIPRRTLEQALSDDTIQAVFIETDDWLMNKYAQIALAAGKHVHMDKPGGDDTPAFRKTLSMAKERNLVFQMAYMYRYNPAVMHALELIRQGKLGDILQVDALMSTEHALWIRKWLKRYQGGTMHTFGCHMIDLILLCQGMPEQVVPFLKKTGLDGVDVNDHDLAVLLYPRGVSTARTSSFEVNGFGRRQLVICGTEGTLELKPLETNYFNYMTPMNVSYKSLTRYQQYEDMHESWRIPPMRNRHDGMIEAFAGMVRGEIENPYSYEYEAQVQLVTMAACGYPVNLKEKIIL